MSLDTWKTRLETNFESLHRQRVLSTKNWPVFILEHGLSSEEVGILQTDIREYISRLSPSNDHILAWVVYATEIGYKYEGYEYWQTFENLTPGWQSYGNRYWLRDCFLRFCDKYGGAKPTGIWAEHFSLICWPIAHAILPLDLQRHLARILYELRSHFSKEMLDNPNILGNMVAERSWNTNSRFQDFAQNPLLVGQIATSLLLQGQEGYESLVLPTTLDRIRDDLEKIRTARDWLSSARSFAQRIRLEGLSKSGRDLKQGIPAANLIQARQQLEEIAVEPRLILRPTDTGRWRVMLDIPDLSQMLVRFPQLKSVLTESRCRVAGSSGRWQARGWTLHGPQQIALDEWPKPDEVLLKFERSTPQLDFLLRTECLLRPGQTYLFKIASDNLAYQIRSLALRSGQKYIIVNTSSPSQQNKWLSSTTLECKNAHAAILEMPNVISSELEQFLQKLDLHVAKSIEVWPAGLTAARWDGEGSAEWISTERPCIGLRVDHDVKNISIVLDDSEALQVVPSAIGKSIFIGFPHLRIGTHKVAVSVKFTSLTVKEETGTLEIKIREPQIWRPGIGNKTAITVIVEPRNPTIEQLWENRIDIQVHGPESRQIGCRLELFEAGRTEPLISNQLPYLKLPIDSSLWRSYFETNVRRKQNIANFYDVAHSCKLVFDNNELGSFTLQCDREFRPLRWLVQRHSFGYLLRLLDDTGIPPGPSACKYEFNKPDKALPQETNIFLKDFVPASNGLYFAQSGEHRSGIILPSWEKGGVKLHDLSQLGLQPEVTIQPRSSDGVINIIRFIEIWSNARLTGDFFSQDWQRQVLMAMTRYLFSMIGGKDWAEGENVLSVSKNPNIVGTLALSVSNKSWHHRLREQLCSIVPRLVSMSLGQRIDALSSIVLPSLDPTLLRLSNEPGVTINWFFEFALRLASNPEETRKWAGQRFRFGIDRLFQQPLVARSARFIVLMTQQEENEVDTGRPVSNWEWS